MQRRTRNIVQSLLLLAMVLAAANLVWIFLQRTKSTPMDERKQAQDEDWRRRSSGLDADAYVTPRKLHLYDLKSARELTQQPVWIREGYRHPYYLYNPQRKRADFEHDAGLMGPIEKLQIKDVATQPALGSKDFTMLLAIFDKDGSTYVLPFGRQRRGHDAQIWADELFFYDDPQTMYKHWPREVWDAIHRHEVVKGMTEIQASFAVGVGVLAASDDPSVKVIDYPNGGNTIKVTFRGGRAEQVQHSAT